MASDSIHIQWSIPMKNRKFNSEKIAAAFTKMVEDKRMIQDHVAQGKDLSELKSKGIHFVKSISL